jgi:hypothetical protein
MEELSKVVPGIPIMLDKERHMVLSLNAMIQFRDATGHDILKGFDSSGGTIEETRALLWACLIDEDPELTQEQVGALVTIQNYMTISEALAQALTVSQPTGKPQSKKVTRR